MDQANTNSANFKLPNQHQPSQLEDIDEHEHDEVEFDNEPNRDHFNEEFEQVNYHDYVNDSRNLDQQSAQGTRLNLEQQLYLLRDLLTIERANNEQRRRNNIVMQKYLQQLQADYLKLQNDLVQALELGQKLKAQKQAQIDCLDTTVKQKDGLIEQLQTQLNNLDEVKLRSEFNKAFEKQQELHRLDLDQLRQQIATGEQQLCRERVNNSQLLQQFQEKLDDQLRLHERDITMMKSRLAQSQDDLERVLSEPQNLIVKALREDKSRLDGQVDELNLSLEETRNKYDSMKKRLELILLEQERLAQQNQDELDRLQQLNVDQRRAINELKLEVDDKQEVIQLLEFNLHRSEKRVKNLLVALKNKEVTYRQLIGQSGTQQRQELDKLNACMQSTEKRLIEVEFELTAKQNELVRLRLEQENQLESLRNDRDERLNKLAFDKTNLARELQAIELKLARECEQSNQRSKLVEQLQREVQQFRDESKRLSIEVTKSEAKLYSKQQELQAALETLAKRDAEQTIDAESQNKLTLTQHELNEEKTHSKRLKANIDELTRENEKLCTKLRIVESNLDRTRSAINKEHEKMMREYEKKIESIRSEQESFDKNKLRYKRYGFKLKKYCEHLKRVHEHLCSPNNCGYIIGPNSARSFVPPDKSKRSTTMNRSDSIGLLDSDGDNQYSDSPYYDDISGDENEHANLPFSPATKLFDKSSHSSDRFIVKRTGISPAHSSPMLKTRHLSTNTIGTRYQPSRVPLRSRSTNLVSDLPTKNASTSNNNLHLMSTNSINLNRQPSRDEHSYYYIKDDCSVKTDNPTAGKSPRPINKLAMNRTKKTSENQQQQQQQRRQQKVLRTVI